MIKVKRIYEPVETDDGHRVLVDRLWPRGITRDRANIDDWLKELAPSHDLRKWFHKDPERWDGFVHRYREELRSPSSNEHLGRLREIAATRTVTLLYAVRNEHQNHAMVLKDAILEMEDDPMPGKGC